MTKYVPAPDELEKIEPADFETVLRTLGWSQSGGIPGLARQWVKLDDESEPSVVIPVRKDIRDYRRRISEAISVIYSAQGKSAEDIVIQFLLPGSDEITNSKDEETIAGSILWESGEKQMLGLKEMLVAAAKSTESRESHFRNRRWKAASRYMSQVRMGQTRVGSYVVTALSPVGALPIDGRSGVYESNFGPTGRDVVNTLFSALSAVPESSDQFIRHSNAGVFLEAVQDGVSLELVRGIKDNLGSSASVETSVSWSPKSDDRFALDRVDFEPKHVMPLEVASVYLSRQEKSSTVTVVGRVVKLESADPEEEGIVTLQILEGSEAPHIRVHLGAEYRKAVEIHGRSLLMVARGKQERPGRDYTLTEVTEVRFFDSRGNSESLTDSLIEEGYEDASDPRGD
ncbi:hypothetical protein AB0H42_31465 [Nocardia sp. NPDC050799]|uniref:hypothetical protein n=1 Tax=Nocardia sp. NPDC050799 TaxID=3154842 RepID=UPI0033D18FB6